MRHTTIRAILCATMLFQGISVPAYGAAAPCVNCAKSKAAAADDDAAPPLTLRAKPVAIRQCAGVYFSAAHSAWFEVDCLVPLEVAQVGVLVTGDVPQAGKVRLWITRVYERPKTSPPDGVHGATATTDASAPTAVDEPGQHNDPALPSESAQSNDADDTIERDGSALDRDHTAPARDDQTTPFGSARFHLRLPPGARLSVEGQPVASEPLERDVVIDHLAAKQLYEYHFVAEVERDGQLHSLERTVGFTAGDEVLLDFTADAALAAGK